MRRFISLFSFLEHLTIARGEEEMGGREREREKEKRKGKVERKGGGERKEGDCWSWHPALSTPRFTLPVIFLALSCLQKSLIMCSGSPWLYPNNPNAFEKFVHMMSKVWIRSTYRIYSLFTTFCKATNASAANIKSKVSSREGSICRMCEDEKNGKIAHHYQFT